MFCGVLVGCSFPDKLYSTVEEYYTRSGKSMKGHHDYQDREYNRGGLLDWERDTITGYFGGRKRLLVLGAGGGREVLALLHLGYEVEAFESHPDLIVSANELLREEGSIPRYA